MSKSKLQFGPNTDIKEQLDRVETKLDALDKKLDKHIDEIWTVYKPIKQLLTKLERFRLW
tara:strand:+ start:578 stop:757 length:180 start_codon:yes stop_codon:yes gene_type:complete